MDDSLTELAVLRERVARLEAELAASRRRAGITESIIDSLAVGVTYSDLAGNLKLINAAVQKMMPGYFERHRPETIVNIPGIYQADGVTVCRHEDLPLVRAIDGEHVDNVEICVRADDDDPGVWINVSARPLYDENGQPCGGVAMFHDVTALRRERLGRQLMQDRFEAVIDNTPSCVYMKDKDGRYLLINRALENLLGRTRSEMLGSNDYELFPREMADAFRQNDIEVMRTGHAIQVDEIAPHEDGPHEYISVKFPVFDAHGAPQALCGISTDISERKRVEEALRVNQRFLTQVLRAHERDRQLMVYELHDGLAQSLAGAVLHLESITAARPAEGTRERNSFDVALELVRKCVAEVRRLMSGLRPLVLDESGLVQGIAYLIAEQEADGGIEIEFDADVRFDRLSAIFEGSLFRIVQESFTNIRRHSRARRAAVSLKQRDDELILTIRDWGVGFDPSQTRSGGLGLEGIRKRVEAIGGTVGIRSAPEEGTTIEVVVALPPNDERPSAPANA